MIKYYIDKTNGVTVARFMPVGGSSAEDEREYWIESLWGYVDNLQMKTKFYFDGEVLAKEVVSGIDNLAGKAKLCPGDTFDEEIGKELAKKRLIAKFYRAKDRLELKIRKRIIHDTFLVCRKMGVNHEN